MVPPATPKAAAILAHQSVEALPGNRGLSKRGHCPRSLDIQEPFCLPCGTSVLASKIDFQRISVNSSSLRPTCLRTSFKIGAGKSRPCRATMVVLRCLSCRRTTWLPLCRFSIKPAFSIPTPLPLAALRAAGSNQCRPTHLNTEFYRMCSTALFRNRFAVFQQLLQPYLNGFAGHTHCMIKRHSPSNTTGQCRNGHREPALLQWRKIDRVGDWLHVPFLSHPRISRQRMHLLICIRDRLPAGLTPRFTLQAV